jgi:hypothetical protein
LTSRWRDVDSWGSLEGEAATGEPANWGTGERELDVLIRRFTGSPARHFQPHFSSSLPEALMVPSQDFNSLDELSDREPVEDVVRKGRRTPASIGEAVRSCARFLKGPPRRVVDYLAPVNCLCSSVSVSIWTRRGLTLSLTGSVNRSIPCRCEAVSFSRSRNCGIVRVCS